jgi:hypothetical protein
MYTIGREQRTMNWRATERPSESGQLGRVSRRIPKSLRERERESGEENVQEKVYRARHFKRRDRGDAETG